MYRLSLINEFGEEVKRSAGRLLLSAELENLFPDQKSVARFQLNSIGDTDEGSIAAILIDEKIPPVALDHASVLTGH